MEVLLSAPVIKRNHPSFAAREADGSQPARAELQGLVEQGFGRLYRTQAEAEQALGGSCHPAPLGDVVKVGADGRVKHRLIQDLRRNYVNGCVGLPERQVLPRAVDHAADLAHASASGDAETLILDYKHAYMTVAAPPAEAMYNCCIIEEAITRERGPLDNDEPAAGCFIVWLVLGFGGKAYPLLYARVA